MTGIREKLKSAYAEIISNYATIQMSDNKEPVIEDFLKLLESDEIVFPDDYSVQDFHQSLKYDMCENSIEVHVYALVLLRSLFAMLSVSLRMYDTSKISKIYGQYMVRAEDD